MGVARVLVFLPWSWQVKIGAGISPLLAMVLKPRRKVVRRNLELCFPELEDAERARIAGDHIRALGVALAETAMAWWGTDKQLADISDCEGSEHLQAALASGNGAILVGAHFTPLEMMGRLLARYFDVWGSYRPLGIPGFDAAMRAGRAKGCVGLIPKDDYRGMLRCLKNNGTLWLAIDQAHTGGKPVKARFFGVPALTSTAICRCARTTGCAVLPFFYERSPDNRYLLRVLPALADFPGDDPVSDLERINRTLEDSIRRAPEQYYWLHRRFKGTIDYDATGAGEP
jgi:KDO2-lipid IV(A) lauroyltransferase